MDVLRDAKLAETKLCVLRQIKWSGKNVGGPKTGQTSGQKMISVLGQGKLVRKT